MENWRHEVAVLSLREGAKNSSLDAALQSAPMHALTVVEGATVGADECRPPGIFQGDTLAAVAEQRKLDLKESFSAITSESMVSPNQLSPAAPLDSPSPDTTCREMARLRL